jgi:putative transposase
VELKVPRIAREKKSIDGIYHITERGNEKKDIFNDDADRIKFLEILGRNKGKYGYKVYAYCLMNNHIHLLISSNGSDISQVMKSINVSYVIYFNRKYNRCGHLFQDRFKSEYIDSDEYLLEVSRYIHLNPVRAGIVTIEKLDSYLWNSFTAYIGERNRVLIPIDTYFILGLLSEDIQQATKQYIKYLMRDEVGEIKIHMPQTGINMEGQYQKAINECLMEPEMIIRQISECHGVEYEKVVCKNTEYKVLRDEMINQIRKKSNISLKEIGRSFHISESAVSKILTKLS